jgi:hypothetical protein
MTAIENSQIKELSAQIQTQNIRLEAQNARLEHYNNHAEEMRGILDNIQMALLGNPISKDGGLVKRIEDVETGLTGITKVLSEYKSKWMGIVWLIVVAGGALGLIYYATSIWKNLLK